MSPALAALRSRIRLLERSTPRPGRTHPFGVPALDEHLPENGLPCGALHEVAAGATLFVAGILARLDRPVLWCTVLRDLYPPGLACAGLSPERVLHSAAPN